MTPQSETKIEIVNGPSEWKIILALFEKRWLEFELRMLDHFGQVITATGKRKMTISRVGRKVLPEQEIWEIDGFLPKELVYFRATYSTKTRKGQLVPGVEDWKAKD